jgi:ubiquinone/menaquinone biosynthesis C-methylase UbiE
MRDKKRIYGRKVDISSQNVHEFFEQRARGYNPTSPLTSVLYQDKTPEVAEYRDALEKETVVPLLNLDGTQRVLDVGCGIGRWADVLHDKVNSYYGLDFSAGLIDIAKKRCKTTNVHFMVGAADDLGSGQISDLGSFDRIIVAGLLIYMNDYKVTRALEGLAKVAGPSCLLYIREPLAIEKRLTLDKFWSEDLNTEYSAIYRTYDEMMALITENLLSAGFTIQIFSPLYEKDSLNNRRETKQFYFILNR